MQTASPARRLLTFKLQDARQPNRLESGAPHRRQLSVHRVSAPQGNVLPTFFQGGEPPARSAPDEPVW